MGGAGARQAGAETLGNAGGRSDEHEDEQEAAARRDKAQAYHRVVSMTAGDVAQSLSDKEDLAVIAPLLLHHRLDGQGLLQVTTGMPELASFHAPLHLFHAPSRPCARHVRRALLGLRMADERMPWHGASTRQLGWLLDPPMLADG